MFRPSLILLIAAATLLSPMIALAGPYTILHVFLQNQEHPSSGFVLDSAGKAYGTTFVGGPKNAGTIYQLSPTTGFHSIYTFSGPDGSNPIGNLAIDLNGDLYGTTNGGGTFSCGENLGCGTVFRLSPPRNGGTSWTESVLYDFTGGGDGWNPVTGVILDQDGNLYGVAPVGGEFQCGVVFELVPSGNDQWMQQTLYSFTGDGCNPRSSLVLDSEGNLYGTTEIGGTWNGGTAFQLSPTPDGQWTYNNIYEFNQYPKDAGAPESGLTFDSMGNLYGTTLGGGVNGWGAVFELMPSGGNWTESILHSFASGNDGAFPRSDLTFDAAGNLYGTTWNGGPNNYGTIYRLKPNQNGMWTETVFVMGTGVLGAQPNGPLLLDGKGRAYGTTYEGGRNKNGQIGWGVIFRLNIGK